MNHPKKFAKELLKDIRNHPLRFDRSDYDENIIGKKIWFFDCPAVVAEYCKNTGIITVCSDTEHPLHIPETNTVFNPPWYTDDTHMSAKAPIIANYIAWYRMGVDAFRMENNNPIPQIHSDFDGDVIKAVPTDFDDMIEIEEDEDEE